MTVAPPHKIPREYYPDDLFINNSADLPPEYIFVFGSNTAGRHGKGAAKTAQLHFGANYGNGRGFSKDLRSYAIATKDENLIPLSAEAIEVNINWFIAASEGVQANNYVINHVGARKFFVTKVGCGLAGHDEAVIAPMFKRAVVCAFPESWKKYLE